MERVKKTRRINNLHDIKFTLQTLVPEPCSQSRPDAIAVRRLRMLEPKALPEVRWKTQLSLLAVLALKLRILFSILALILRAHATTALSRAAGLLSCLQAGIRAKYLSTV
jgi:hypothetical protein